TRASDALPACTTGSWVFLLNYLICSSQQRFRDGEAERLRGFEVYDNPANSTEESTLRDLQEAARTVGVQIQVLDASTIPSMQPSPLLHAIAPMPSSSRPTHSLPAAACKLPPWQRAAGFRRLIPVVRLWKPAG